MDVEAKWELVYRNKAANAVSWFCPQLETSLALIQRVCGDPLAAIIDVGGGASTLADDLLTDGYRDITVLDISKTALDVTKNRLGSQGENVRLLAANILDIHLSTDIYDLWHDRAVFHFLTAAEDRIAYVNQVISALKPGGNVVISTFGSDGPTRCSGSDVARYDAEALALEFGSALDLVESLTEWHTTPAGVQQQFTYCVLRKR